jgi:hypothetical protein
MNRGNWAATTLALAALAGCATTPNGGGGGSPPPPPPPPSATTLITDAQPFDYRVADPADLTGKVSFVWSDKFGAVPGVTTCHYAPAYRSNAQTTAWFVANHPDWVMRKADRSIAYEFGNTAYTPLDIANPAVVAFLQTTIAAAMKPGQSWLCLDNVDAENSAGEVGHIDGSGAWVAPYTGQPHDAKWLADNVSYLTGMVAWERGQGAGTMINDSGNSAEISLAEWWALADTVDGVMKEGWPIDGCASDPPGWVNGYVAGDQFDLEYSEAVQAIGAPTFQLSYFCGHPLAQATNAEIAWVTATRLLTAGPDATDNLIAAPGAPPQTDDASVEAYPASMNPMVGPVTDAPPAPGGRPYVRRFAHGLVALNPTDAPESVVVPAGADQFGQAVPAGPYALAPMGAVVIVTP